MEEGMEGVRRKKSGFCQSHLISYMIYISYIILTFLTATRCQPGNPDVASWAPPAPDVPRTKDSVQVGSGSNPPPSAASAPFLPMLRFRQHRWQLRRDPMAGTDREGTGHGGHDRLGVRRTRMRDGAAIVSPRPCHPRAPPAKGQGNPSWAAFPHISN